jgi:hypothetical protein
MKMRVDGRRLGSQSDGEFACPAALTVAGRAISAEARAATVSFRSFIVIPLSFGLL